MTNGLDKILQYYPSAGVITAEDFNEMRLNLLRRRIKICEGLY